MIQTLWKKLADSVAFGTSSRLVVKGNERRDAGAFAEAANFYRKAIERDPDWAEIRVQYANMLKDSGEPDRAISEYRRALLKRPSDWDIYLQLARAHLAVDDRRASREALTTALELCPGEPTLLGQLADLDRREPVLTLVETPPDADQGSADSARGLSEGPQVSESPPAADHPEPEPMDAALMAETADFFRANGLTPHSKDLTRLAAASGRLGRIARRMIETPRASVILQLADRHAMALGALAALVRHRSLASYEVIVCGSGRSDPATDALFAAIPWLSFVPAEADERPAQVLERARHVAKGEAIVVLDVRTAVVDGWLDATLDRLDRSTVSGRSAECLQTIVGGPLVPGLDRDLGSFAMRAPSGPLPGKMLVVDHYVPEPDRDAGSRSMLDLVANAQALGWSVLFWPYLPRPDRRYVEALRCNGVEVLTAPWVESFDMWMASNAWRVDLVLLCRPTVAPVFLPTIRKHSAVPVMFYGHDLHAARMRREAEVLADEAVARDAAHMATEERGVWRSVDVVLYPSDEEVDEIRGLDPQVICCRLIPFCFDTFKMIRPPPVSKTILFVAGFAHTPNVDAAQHLVRDILPRVLSAVPDAHLALVGSHPTPGVIALKSQTVEVTGWISSADLSERYAHTRVAVVPLRFGAGVKLKVVEALHEGVPLVTTPIGAQGLPGLSAICDVLETPDAIADAIIRLLIDDQAWLSQTERQLAYVAQACARQAAIECLASAIQVAFKVSAANEGYRYLGPIGSDLETARLRETKEASDLTDPHYIDRLYRIILRRPPDAEGLALYLVELSTGQISRDALIETMLQSDERLRHTAS